MTPTVLDTHVHFIDPGRLTYPWLDGVLNRPHVPLDYAAEQPGPASAIMVEAGRLPQQAADEIGWIRGEAVGRPWLRGIVAHADIEAPDVEPTLRGYGADPLVVGVRRNLQDDPDGFIGSPTVRRGVRLLGEHGLPFDACVRARQVPELIELARACPDTTIVLDHLGKPAPGPGHDAWRVAVAELAALPNVVCKLSGLATEAPPDTPRDYFVQTLAYALRTFGAQRCLYGSDWPILNLATSCADWLDTVREAVDHHDAGMVGAVLAGNAERVYLAPRTA